MKKILVVISTALFTISCTSFRIIDKEEMKTYNNQKNFNVTDFKIYVFNICEKYADDVEGTDRFCECPEDFFDVAISGKIRKVEELYMLIHRKTDLVLYLTTTSHKYIYKTADGFLNDPKKFKNNIVLNEVENIYIGRKDTVAGYIHFPSHKDINDIILHYDKTKFPDQIFLTTANLATAENNYDISEEIPLDSVFNQDLVYKYQKNLSLSYYEKALGQPRGEIPLILDRIAITSKKGKVEILLGFENRENLFQLSKMKIKYHSNYSLIQTH